MVAGGDDGGGGDGGGDGGGGDGGGGEGGGEGGGDGGGGDGGGDGGSPLTSSAQHRTARRSVAASHEYTSMLLPSADTWCSPGSLWSQCSHTHTCSASCPQPVYWVTGSSARVQRRAPYSLHRASASYQVASCRQPPMPADELPQTPSAVSNDQPSCSHR